MMSTLSDVLNNEIPTGRRALVDSQNNLIDVASYCEENYQAATDKTKALEETKNYVNQSLANVAYQINSLATSMMNMMDIQATQLSNMESNINNIAQTVSLHKERVARREIGILTTGKHSPQGSKITPPAHLEKPKKYKSGSIQYNILDAVGHGTNYSEGNTKQTPPVETSATLSRRSVVPATSPTRPQSMAIAAQLASRPTPPKPPPIATSPDPPPPPATEPDNEYMNMPPPPADMEVPSNLDDPAAELPDMDMPAPPEFLENDEPSWVPSSYIEKVIAIYDYNAVQEDELNIKGGAVIYVLEKNVDGWYEGIMDGSTGLFPGNYVELCP